MVSTFLCPNCGYQDLFGLPVKNRYGCQSCFHVFEICEIVQPASNDVGLLLAIDDQEFSELLEKIETAPESDKGVSL